MAKKTKQKAAKQIAAEAEEAAKLLAVLPSVQFIRDAINEADVTQVIDLQVPEDTCLTAFFAEGSKAHIYLWPGVVAKIGHTPHSNSSGRPPLRSSLYSQYPELVGKVYSVSLREMEKARPGIARRWKKVCCLSCDSQWLRRRSRTPSYGRLMHGWPTSRTSAW